MTVKAIPQGHHSLTPYLIVQDGAAAIDFYQRAFGAEVTLRMDMPGGSLAHAELKIGDSPLMLSEENPQWQTQSPKTLGGTPLSLMLYLPDVDSAFAKAIAAGATELMPLKDQFYGDRSGTVLDPFGHQWTLGTHIEDVGHEELQRRMAAMFQ
ncbi:VOC family protein [Gallaecimonas kandeliae]|uniref:VOC family protein n=1 Tax=Gallaecimonas kandeliae TaxID=3029055 RepID=UPI002649ED3C|nr:VOC family protein [Gallaecimonas kandeliae]WKE65017.1 VOC family protein [Gallaecimonas kandeliae]